MIEVNIYEKRPTRRSVKFNGRFINLIALSKLSGIDHSVLSRILTGKRTLTIPNARVLATCFTMGLERFISTYEAHVLSLADSTAEVVPAIQSAIETDQVPSV